MGEGTSILGVTAREEDMLGSTTPLVCTMPKRLFPIAAKEPSDVS